MSDGQRHPSAVHHSSFLIHHSDVVVIGGGFYGLTAAAVCERHGVSCRVFEAGPAPLTFWRRMPAGMVTRSYAPHTTFPFDGLRLHDFFRQHGRRRRLRGVPADDLVAYADWFVERTGLRVETGAPVSRVEPAGGRLRVHVEGGAGVEDGGTLEWGLSIDTSVCVLATGAHHRAFVPPEWREYVTATGPCRHWRDVGDYDAFLGDGQRVLVVGGGQSGCEAAAAVLRTGRGVVHACRSPLRVVPRQFEAAIYHLHERFVTPVMNVVYRGDRWAPLRPVQRRLYDWLLAPSVAEEATAPLRGPRYHRCIGTASPMAGDGARIVTGAAGDGYQGDVEVSRAGPQIIADVAGERMTFDRVILATGYRASVRQDPLVDRLCAAGIARPDERESYLLTDELFRSLPDRRVVIAGALAAPSQGPTCAFVAGLGKFRDCVERVLRARCVL